MKPVLVNMCSVNRAPDVGIEPTPRGLEALVLPLDESDIENRGTAVLPPGELVTVRSLKHFYCCDYL